MHVLFFVPRQALVLEETGTCPGRDGRLSRERGTLVPREPGPGAEGIAEQRIAPMSGELSLLTVSEAVCPECRGNPLFLCLCSGLLPCGYFTRTFFTVPSFVRMMLMPFCEMVSLRPLRS